MPDLPLPSTSFSEKKTKILQQLAVPDSEYTDLSPKGSVDVGIRDLIEEINAFDGLVTTSSCAGRVSVFLEGRKVAEAGEHDGQLAAVGGKGAGGTWLFVSHDPVPDGDNTWLTSLNLSERGEAWQKATQPGQEKRLIHFKFEPMILHVLTTSLAHAQLILRCAMHAGFRESGAVSLTASGNDNQPTPVVAIRSMGLGFESLIGHQIGDQRDSTVSVDYLHSLMVIANERFTENTKRIERFRNAFQEATVPQSAVKRNPDGEEWEDPAARRERKRAEGLRRKAQLEAEKAESNTSLPDDPPPTNLEEQIYPSLDS